MWVGLYARQRPCNSDLGLVMVVLVRRIVDEELLDGGFESLADGGVDALLGFHGRDDHGVVILQPLHVVVLGILDALSQEVVGDHHDHVLRVRFLIVHPAHELLVILRTGGVGELID